MENYSGLRNGEAKELEGERCEEIYGPGKNARSKNDSQPSSYIYEENADPKKKKTSHYKISLD